MKKLGFGCMRFPLLDAEDNTSIDFPQVCQMVDLFLERGFTYFDTAYFYHGGTSEETVNRCLVQRHPRDSFTLATKLPLAKLKEATPQEQTDMFQLQLKRCGVEFFDYYLLHCIDDENYEIAQRLDSFAFVQQKKAEGYIRQAGFSFHGTPELLEEVLTQHPEVDFVQLQINYLDWENPKVQSRRCYEVAVAHHKPVVVMEPVKGGKLANPSPAVRDMFAALDPNASPSSFAIRFAASLEHVFMVLSGMSSLEQVADNTGYMADFRPVSPQEVAGLEQAAQQIQADGTIPCTACSYCTDGCPQRIPIPALFALYNRTLGQPGLPHKKEYRELCAQGAPASACIACGQCEGACPQHLEVVNQLQRVANVFEH